MDNRRLNNKISLIIPTYNAPDKLHRALTSVFLNRHSKNIEIIVVNDCSTKDYNKVIYHWIKQGMNLKYIKNKENVGAGVSRQIGIDKAKNEWIGFMDDDDLISENWYTVLDNAIDMNTDKDILAFKILHKHDDDRQTHISMLHNHVGGYLIRKKFLIDNNIKFDNWLRYAEDKYFINLCMYCAIYENRVAFVNNTLYFWETDNRESTTHMNKIDWNFIGNHSTVLQFLWLKENKSEIYEHINEVKEKFREFRNKAVDISMKKI